jgi:hypothetical protein
MLHYHPPIARVTVSEVIPVVEIDTTICTYIPEHRGCPEAKKEGK